MNWSSSGSRGWTRFSADRWVRHAFRRNFFFDVRGSVHHRIIHIRNPTRCNSVSKFYFIFIWSSTCFGRHTTHHQEPKTVLALVLHTWRVVGRVVAGCCQVDYEKLPSHTPPDSIHQLQVQQPSTYVKPEAASAVLDCWWWVVCRPKQVEIHVNIK